MVPSQQSVDAFLAEVVDLHSGDPAPSLAATAEQLGTLGVPAGTPVLIALPNGKALLVFFFAILLTGGVPVPVPPASSSVRLADIARRIGAGALIAPRIARDGYGGAVPHRVGGVELLLFPHAEPHRHPSGSVLLMTSGTSGIASGCLHGIDALLRNARGHADAIGQRAQDTILVNLPLFYSYALVAQALAALVRGSRLVISGPPFTPQAYADTVRAQQISISSLTPVLVTRLLNERVGALERLRILTVGGDLLAPRYVRQVLDRIAGTELYLTYGLAEAGPRVCTLAAHREPPHRYGSAGLPLAGTRTRLRAVPHAGGAGELLVESDMVLRRRIPDDAHDPRVAERTIATGDLFDIDEDGYHYFRGRLTDSVTVNGEKVWLPSVREIVSSIPGVRRASTSVHQTDDGSRRYDLEVYVDDPDSRWSTEIERVLARRLLRGERPDRVRIRPAAEAPWHK